MTIGRPTIGVVGVIPIGVEIGRSNSDFGVIAVWAWISSPGNFFSDGGYLEKLLPVFVVFVKGVHHFYARV
jgi:hypothetical protein